MKPLVLLVAAATLPFALTAAHGQNPPPPAPPPAPIAPPRPLSAPTAPAVTATVPAPPEERRFDIELQANIPAQEAAELVSQRAGRPFNVIWSGDSASTPLPALRLHQVTLREFCAAITAAGRNEHSRGHPVYSFTEVADAPNVFMFMTEPPPQRQAGSMPTGVQLNTIMGPQPSRDSNAKQSMFFDVSGMLGPTLSVDDITTAIRAAWAAAAEGDEPPVEALKYHQETQLLIATGTREHLEVLANMLTLLRARNQPSQDAKDREIQGLTREIALLSSENTRLENLRSRTEEDSRQHLAKLRERIAELEIELAKQQKAP